MRVRKISKSDY